ncbi:outer membrane lipoprotein chaperone LolA [Amphibiibacter pelophylacis]|uniref:Outer membrane lipoprotein chaperone LolA n=1 Tax=Amphibiibacter pelophylacis TaxID=1799477 RepID=A0ACC6P312_9BURK
MRFAPFTPVFHRRCRTLALTALGSLTLALAAPAAVLAQTAAPAAQTAQSGSAALKAFLTTVQSGQSTFTQTVLGRDDKPKSTSQGEFSFVRPDRFRFVYTKPYQQTIVSDGQTLWFYDQDLAQVTKRKASEALASTPVAVLAGGDLEKSFEIKDLPARDGQSWVQATPRQEGGSVKTLRMGLKDGGLATLEIDDALGQRSVIRFERFQANARVNTADFRFTPPKGVEVLSQ